VGHLGYSSFLARVVFFGAGFSSAFASAAFARVRGLAGAFSLVTVFLIPNAPAGIAVYFIASGVWQMMQQGVIRIVWPLPPVPTPQEVLSAKPPPPPPRKRKRRR